MISDATDIDRLVHESATVPVVVFKHSNQCNLSASAYTKLSELQSESDPAVYQITVQEARAVSNYVESHFGIRHESPQIIILSNGKPVFHASHRRVSAETVRSAIAENYSG